MARWFEFMGNHPFLFGLLFLLIIVFFMVENKRSGKKIPPSELGLLVNNQNAKLIDIRPKAKFKDGHIQGSENIPFTELAHELPRLKALTVPVIFICEMGMQAGAAATLLGGDHVYRLEGGILGWQGAGMPLVGTPSKA